MLAALQGGCATSGDADPDTKGFAWQMLKALTTSATVEHTFRATMIDKSGQAIDR